MKRMVVISIIIFSILSCTQEYLTFWDINTGWENDTLHIEDILSDTFIDTRIYEYACTEIPSNTISVEGRVLYNGDIPDTARLSVAITNKPPPGMPSCYFTVKPLKFPFGFRFTGLERGSMELKGNCSLIMRALSLRQL